MKNTLLGGLAAALLLAGCATAAQTQVLYGDLEAALTVAMAAESAFSAAQPNADPKVMQQIAALTGAAQAALSTLQANPTSVTAATAAQAAVAALTSYLAQQGATKALAARAPHA